MGKYAYRIVGFALAGLLPSIVFGAGLGRLTVLSSLGQPLKAEIEIVSVQPGEAESLSAALAPQDAFRQANVELNGVLFDVRFAILRRQNGQYAVVLSSTRPLNEPFLEMLVELKGSSGTLVREYTFLLDPPEYKGSAVASAAVPVAPPAAQPLPSEKPATAEGAPSVRMVLLKGVSPSGFEFFTNYASRKARELDANPRAALCFFWPALGLQVRVEGDVARLTSAESASYFATRPRESQIGAWASKQSQPLASGDELEARFRETESRFAGGTIPLPPFWGGYRLSPRRIEVWKGRDFRLHERTLYTREGASWTIERLYP